MTRSTHPSHRPAGRWLVLLVMAVLVGLLGMHALAPGGAPAAHANAGHEMARTMDAAHSSEDCSHAHHEPGHLNHADGTCSAAGVGSAYAPPALTAAAVDAPVASPLSETAPVSAEASRAPPGLSELQLLRI
ncbi:DUF6153 family protein [Streptomyces sp. NPDC048430]|uniref:DUF6153 family protein n=1 Tax=unclassified Streptomyces TaxID=2593676 RepID=UPI00342880DD